jgi:type I restriction enzyme R subunit
MGEEIEFQLPGASIGTDQAKFTAKARAFLRQHLNHVSVAKLRRNLALTSSDLADLRHRRNERGAICDVSVTARHHGRLNAAQ